MKYGEKTSGCDMVPNAFSSMNVRKTHYSKLHLSRQLLIWLQEKKVKSAYFIALTSTVSLLLWGSYSNVSNSNQKKRPTGFQDALSGFCRFLQTIYKTQTWGWSEPLLRRHLRPAKLNSSLKNTKIVCEQAVSSGQMNSNADRKVNRVQTLIGTVAARVGNNLKPYRLLLWLLS